MMTASTASASSQVSGQGPAGTVNFNSIDVTLSAAFYTGVFLSSRELQGNYLCHQDMVVGGMETDLPWGWDFPRYGCEHWNGTVSPVYFIGTDLSNIGDMGNKIQFDQKIQNSISNFRNDFKVGFISLRVQFFEFGFGLVSMDFKDLEHKYRAVNSATELEQILQNCRESSRNILSCISKKATKIYRKSVPCCIKNSDIWDIDNFAGLEISCETNSSEGIYKIGGLEKMQVFATLEANNMQSYISNNSYLEQSFLYFSQKPINASYNTKFKLFKSDCNVILASIPKNNRQTNQIDLDYIIQICEMLTINIEVGRYFNNFFYSYYNYLSGEYEIIISKKMHYSKNIIRIRGLFEKFFDSQTLYFQVYHKLEENKHVLDNGAKIQLCNQLSELFAVDKIWNNSNLSAKKIMKLHDQIKSARSEQSLVSQLHIPAQDAFLALGMSAMAINISALTAYGIAREDYRPMWIIYVSASAVIIMLAAIAVWRSSRFLKKEKKRKLFYFCKSQKKYLKKQQKNQLKRNKLKKNCECNVSGCHRCSGSEWHSRVFYRSENLCFRCGISECGHGKSCQCKSSRRNCTCETA